MTLRRLARLVPLFVLLVLTSGVARAQVETGKDHIKFEKIAPVSGRAGDTVMVRVKAKIDRYWHTYGTRPVEGPMPTEITPGPKGVLRSGGKVKALKGSHTAYDKIWETEVEEWAGTVELDVPVRIDPSLKKGTAKAQINVYLQLCDTAACMPPEDITLPLMVDVTAEAVAGAADTASAQAESPSNADHTSVTGKAGSSTPILSDTQREIQQEKAKGLWSFFLYAMGWGFLALLTPCVFPMIPITVSFFTKRHEKRTGSGIRDSTVFGIGVISTFTLIGLVAAVVFKNADIAANLAASPLLNMVIATVFTILAFNLFGAFEIQIPVSILNALNKKSQGDGMASVWLMGLTFALTSFTCTVPFLGGVLSSAATGGEFLFPLVGTLGFATAFAVPFVVLSMFPALLVRLPRAGGWMNNMKVVMGFIEIGAAVKFISSADLAAGWGIMPREVFLSIWAGLMLLSTIYVLGMFQMKLDSPTERIGGIRAGFAVIFATLTFWFSAGAMGRDMSDFIEALLPPHNYKEMMGGGVATASVAPGASEVETEKWYTNLDEAKKVAQQTGKPIFIDFTGFTCQNCRLMEKTVFPKPMIRERFEKFVLVQLYTDRREEPYISNQNLLKTYGTVANPLYVMLKSDGSYVGQTGYQPLFSVDASAFAKFLDRALVDA
jgi:thiol:disulfide interchange protein DsbD